MKSTNAGLVIWLTGLAGSGKSTIGRALYEEIRKHIAQVIYLDGDEFRDLLGEYGYDRQSRIAMAKKRSDFARFLSHQGMVVIVTTISMFDEIYAYNKQRLAHYYEVYIKCAQEELHKRDQKGLYSQALQGKIKEVVGVDIPYDEPRAHLVIDNTAQGQLAQKVHFLFEQTKKGFL